MSEEKGEKQGERTYEKVGMSYTVILNTELKKLE